MTTTLTGWVYRRRDHGGLIFIDLRDAYGLTQIVFDPAENKEAHKVAESVRPEWVIQVSGIVKKRMEGMENKNIDTGDIEVFGTQLNVLNKAKTPPFEIDSDAPVGEEHRLKYRYLDLRRERMLNNLRLRDEIVLELRQYFSDSGFLDVETPCLVKGTPEGAREYLVPSRVHPGEFYVLPQSPQQMKQLLMVAGVDKYVQVARCFRDEDLRGDRQPEFTQLDFEMSFVEQEDVLDIMEGCFLTLTDNVAPHKNYEKYLDNGRMKRITWQEAMEKYGSDKPDVRFDLSFVNVTEAVKESEFGVFSSAEYVTAMCVPGGAKFSRSEIDDLTRIAKDNGAGGLAYITVQEGGELKSPILKFLSETEQKAIVDATKAEAGSIIFFGAGEFIEAVEALGAVRKEVGARMNLADSNDFAYLLVVDFPMFEKLDDGRMQAMHHPFTMPHPYAIHMMDGFDKDLLKMRT